MLSLSTMSDDDDFMQDSDQECVNPNGPGQSHANLTSAGMISSMRKMTGKRAEMSTSKTNTIMRSR